ncbi:hypothetical protein STEG23_020511, partial [Scotinomys teguina]
MQQGVKSRKNSFIIGQIEAFYEEECSIKNKHFLIMILIPIIHRIPLLSLQLDSWSLAWYLAVDLCNCFYQLLDEGSKMTVRVFTDLITGFQKATNNKKHFLRLPDSKNSSQKVLKTETQGINAMQVADALRSTSLLLKESHEPEITYSNYQVKKKDEISCPLVCFVVLVIEPKDLSILVLVFFSSSFQSEVSSIKISKSRSPYQRISISFILPCHRPNDFIYQPIRATYIHSIQKDIPQHQEFIFRTRNIIFNPAFSKLFCTLESRDHANSFEDE